MSLAAVQSPAEETRFWLRTMCCYPTERGVEQAQSAREQEVTRKALVGVLARLDPGDLLALYVLACRLAEG